LRPAAKALGGTLGGVFLDECGKLGTGKVLEQLIEEARDLYDWVALLWAAFGEAPRKEWLANVNYRRALLLFQTAGTCFGQGCLQIGMNPKHLPHLHSTGGSAVGLALVPEELPLRVREAAVYLGVSVQTVYLWVERKQIPHLRVMGRNIRFLKSDLEPFRATFKQEVGIGETE
jgi:excisionase family DNA binding protein